MFLVHKNSKLESFMKNYVTLSIVKTEVMAAENSSVIPAINYIKK